MASDPITPEINALFESEIRALTLSLSDRSRLYAVMPNLTTRCNNCVWDPRSKSSSGRYNGTGPKSFTAGVCPVCKGAGTLQQTRMIKIRGNVQYPEKADLADIKIPVGKTAADVLIAKVLIEDDATVQKASHLMFNGNRYIKQGQPAYRGLKKYVLAVYTILLDK